MSELPKGFVTAGHAILFQDSEAHRCDVCAEVLGDGSQSDDSDDPTYDVRGRGLLVWSRGGADRRWRRKTCSGWCI